MLVLYESLLMTLIDFISYHTQIITRHCCEISRNQKKAPSWRFNLALLHREYRRGLWLRSDVGRSSKTGSNQPDLPWQSSVFTWKSFVVNSQSTTTNCGKTSIRKRVASSIMGCSLFQTALMLNHSRQTMTPSPSQDQFKTRVTK